MKYSKTFVLKNHLQFANQFFFIYLNLSVFIKTRQLKFWQVAMKYSKSIILWSVKLQWQVKYCKMIPLKTIQMHYKHIPSQIGYKNK